MESKQTARKVSRDAAVAALIAQPTIKGAAAACGIAEKTLHTWLNEPDFAKQVREAQQGVSRATMGRLLSSIGLAIDTLAEIAGNAEQSPGPRVTAARAILDHSLKIYELEAVQKRIEALEERLNPNG